MRKIDKTSQFKRDYKREAKGKHRVGLDEALMEVVSALAGDVPLPAKYSDHALSGEWKDHRDCHVKPDLVLIYRKTDADPRYGWPAGLVLARLGSHAELGW